MASYKTSLNAKAGYVLGLAFLLLITLICAASGFKENDSFALAKQETLLRKIGHEILLHAGDSVSRVLPVKKINAGQYQIRFEKEFTFQPDSLVRITQRSLAKDDLAGNYVVSVLNCSGEDVLFSYGIFKKEQDSIVPCSGRQQPKRCYLVDIKFQNSDITMLPQGYLIGGISLFAFVGLLIARPLKIRRKGDEAAKDDTGTLQIGNTLFDPGKQQVVISGITTKLTPKENKLLLIFAQSPNIIIERSRLQKEIWEDEGIIVGRSLDVFISKLRKILENDPSIQLTNIHGKGYKLETCTF